MRYPNGILNCAAFLVVAACASGGQATRSTSTELTREEMATINAANLYEAVQRLRPRWLEVRGERSFNMPVEIVVFENNTLLGGPEALRDLTPSSIDRLRYIDGPRASATLPGLGTRAVQHAIVIEMRRQE